MDYGSNEKAPSLIQRGAFLDCHRQLLEEKEGAENRYQSKVFSTNTISRAMFGDGQRFESLFHGLLQGRSGLIEGSLALG